MFPSNLMKKPKMDSKRAKAIAFFNNKFPNSPIVEKSGFWTLNRVKILFSAGVALITAWSVQFAFPQGSRGKPFLALLAYLYLVSPFIWYRAHKHLTAIKVKKEKFVKVISRVYRQSELPCGIVFSAIFLSGIAGIIIANFIAELLKGTIAKEYMFVTILLLPFLMYHLLCFIGNHPLSIFTAVAHQTNKALAPYTRHNAQQPGYMSGSSNDYHNAQDGGDHLSGNQGMSYTARNDTYGY